MKIVIEIPDRIYKIIQTHRTLNIMDDEILENALKNGTPLHPNGNWTRRHYIYGDKTLDMWVCSRCGEEFSYDAETGASIYDYDYCPNCGNYKRNKAEGDIE